MTTPSGRHRPVPLVVAAAYLFSSTLAVSIPLTAHAQESPPAQATPADNKTQTMRKVTVTDATPNAYTVESSGSATSLPLTLRETPQSLTVVTRERLDDQNLTSLREVLDNTPGIYSYAYDSERVLFTSRGFVIDNLLYDGVPAVTNFNTDSLDETLDTALYDRIEIVRGATGLMTGAGSPAASVNLVRKHADSSTFGAEFGATAGSWDERRFEADVVTPLTADGSVRARAIGVYQDRDSYQDLYSNKRKVFYGVIDADISATTLLSISYDRQQNEPRGNTWGSFPLFLADGTPANWSRSVTTATDWSFWDRTKDTVFAELKHEFANGWSLSSSLTWRRYQEDLALFYVYGFPDPQTGEGLEPYAYRSDGEITEKILAVHASGQFPLFGRQHELVLGYNGSRTANVGRLFAHGDLAPTGNFFQWDGSYPRPEFSSEGTRITDIDTWQHGAYAAARFSLADPVHLIAGMRYSLWKTESFNIYEAPDATLDYDYSKVIPYAGLVYDFAGNYSAFASYTGIFKPQNKRDVNGSYLDPIDGRSYEVGIKGEHFDGRLNTALTVFETRQNDVATAVYDASGAAILLPDGTQASRSIDGTRTRGFELEASGELRTGWNASLGWSRYQLEDADGHSVRNFVPRTLVRLFTTWTPSGSLQGLTLGGGVNWQSDSNTFVETPDGGTTLEQRDVTLLNLMARYHFTPKISLQVNADNVLDKKYFVLDEYGNSYYGAPTSISVGVDVKL